jgi:hypothetical protein
MNLISAVKPWKFGHDEIKMFMHNIINTYNGLNTWPVFLYCYGAEFVLTDLFLNPWYIILYYISKFIIPDDS